MIEEVVSVRLPVGGERLVIRKNRHVPQGTKKGEEKDLKRLCIVSGIHGDELEGQYIAYELNRILSENPEHLKGIVDVYPAFNPMGIDTMQRGIPRFDLDMNRIFPGSSQGAVAEWVASELIKELTGADFAIDIHASNVFLREIPQVRINVNTADVLVPYAKHLDVDFVWIHQAVTVLESTLAYSLNSIGVKTLVVEAGVGLRITQDYGERLVNGILNLMKSEGMWTGDVKPVREPIVSLDRAVSFINAEAPGVFIPTRRHSDHVKVGEEVGRIVDPLTGTVKCRCCSEVNGLLFTLREFPVVNEGSLIARILGEAK
jgi:hypothetical protein